MHAHEANLVSDGMVATIVVSYLAIALLFFVRKRLVGEAKVVNPTYLISVFVLCAVSGYLPRLMAVNETLLLYSHMALAWFAWGYVVFAVVDLMQLASDRERDESANASSGDLESDQHAVT